MSRPSLKGLKRFLIPHGLYTQRTGQLNRKLLRLYRKVRAKRITKAQAKSQGKAIIEEQAELLQSDCRRFFTRQGLECPEPETKDELDQFIRDKIEEWVKIVDDM